MPGEFSGVAKENCVVSGWKKSSLQPAKEGEVDHVYQPFIGKKFHTFRNKRPLKKPKVMFRKKF